MFGRLLASLTLKEKLALRIAGGILTFGLLAGGAQWVRQNTIVVPRAAGTYTEGFVGQPINLNPALGGESTIDRDLAALLYSDLATLAATITPSEGGRIWEVVLKDDTRWSDGETLSADDVRYTIDTIQDPQTNSPYAQTWRGVVVERTSERAIRISLKTPYAFLIDNLRELRIIPQHIFGNIPTANLRLSSYNLEVVGSGPYTFTNFEKRKDGFVTAYTMSANSRYSGKMPYIEHIVAKFFAENRELIRAWSRNEIDGFGGQSNAVIQELSGNYNTHNVMLPQYYALFENQSLHQALKNPVVRKALRATTDRDRIIKKLFDWNATPSYGPIPKNIEGHTEALYVKEAASSESATSMLETDGWKIGNDGVREKPLGKKMIRLEFEVLVPQIQFLVDTATMIKEDWAKIGAKLVVVPVAPEELATNAIKPRNYQLLLFGNTLKNNPDVFEFWHSSERFYTGANLALYDNKKVDGLLETIRRTMDITVRAPLIAKLQEIIHDDAPAIFLFSPNYRYIVTSALQGFKAERLVTPADRFRFVNEWYIKTKRVFK